MTRTLAAVARDVRGRLVGQDGEFGPVTTDSRALSKGALFVAIRGERFDGNDYIAIRSMMNACLSFDHRVTDGAEALRFLKSVKQHVEAFGDGTSIY